MTETDENQYASPTDARKKNRIHNTLDERQTEHPACVCSRADNAPASSGRGEEAEYNIRKQPVQDPARHIAHKAARAPRTLILTQSIAVIV
jgi:hypothetical protein